MVRLEWDESNMSRIAEHGLSQKDVEAILAAEDFEVRRRGQRLRYTGHGTVDGRLYRVVLVQVADGMMHPITAHRCNRREYA